MMDEITPEDAAGVFEIEVPESTTPEDVMGDEEVPLAPNDKIVLTPNQPPFDVRLLVLKVTVRKVTSVIVEYTRKPRGKKPTTYEEIVSTS